MSEYIINIENVSKVYQLGAIGRTTLKEEIGRWWQRIKGVDGGNLQRDFVALDGINLKVKKGERLGIIGHNGAGKSTLLKILSRITTPTTGTVSYNGRISSMLEVGTGFHGELTGRENIYMNGAILGMTKKEIDAKIDDIIEFSGIEKFIDTPAKRYSSGMYVKLAFSVASYLDNDIMIMDEVLAVGDMNFREKCLNKMNAVSKDGQKTILYVSHNMATVRQLCDRCIVMDHGKIIFDGEVEKAISLYLGIRNSTGSELDLRGIERENPFNVGLACMETLLLDREDGTYEMDSVMKGKLLVSSTVNVEKVILGICFHYQGVAVVTMKSAPVISLSKEKTIEIPFEIDLSRIAPGKYTTKIVLSTTNEIGQEEYYDGIMDSYAFEITQKQGFMHNQRWNIKYNGYLTGAEIKVLQQ